MARHHRPHPAAPSGFGERRASIDDLIRPGLRLAYPVPTQVEVHEEQFRTVLDALAERGRSGSQGAGERESVLAYA